VNALSVERLALHVSAMTEDDARRLVAQVADALSRRPLAPAAPAKIATVAANVEAGTAAPETGRLAEQIADAVVAAALRELH
jgi:hypothetical protein